MPPCPYIVWTGNFTHTFCIWIHVNVQTSDFFPICNLKTRWRSLNLTNICISLSLLSGTNSQPTQTEQLMHCKLHINFTLLFTDLKLEKGEDTFKRLLFPQFTLMVTRPFAHGPVYLHKNGSCLIWSWVDSYKYVWMQWTWYALRTLCDRIAQTTYAHIF